MNLLKKLGVSILAAAMLTVSTFGISPSNAYAATSCKKVIKPNITYKYDIDGDKDKDTIKVYESKGKLLLKVNSCTTTLISDYNTDYYSYNVKIYDFNNKDKSAEIVLEWAGDSECATRILKFKNNTCKVNKFYYDASVSSYNPNTGMLSLAESELGRYSKFTHAIGCFSCIDKVSPIPAIISLNGRTVPPHPHDDGAPLPKRKAGVHRFLCAFQNTHVLFHYTALVIRFRNSIPALCIVPVMHLVLT